MVGVKKSSNVKHLRSPLLCERPTASILGRTFWRQLLVNYSVPVSYSTYNEGARVFFCCCCFFLVKRVHCLRKVIPFHLVRSLHLWKNYYIETGRKCWSLTPPNRVIVWTRRWYGRVVCCCWGCLRTWSRQHLHIEEQYRSKNNGFQSELHVGCCCW